MAREKSDIKSLSDDWQDAYRQIVALSTLPQNVDLACPLSKFEPTSVMEKDGTESALPKFANHLLCDQLGKYPAELKGWEQRVLDSEMQRDGFLFWYRNPDRPSQDSLGIAYEFEDDTKILRPDFLFFAKDGDDVVVDIVDPHGHHLSDALAKLQGLARYAENHATEFRRIEAVAEINDKLRVLDLTNEAVRTAIANSDNAKLL